MTKKAKAAIDRELRESLKDVQEGRVYGPFSSADEMLRALHKGTRTIRKTKNT